MRRGLQFHAFGCLNRSSLVRGTTLNIRETGGEEIKVFSVSSSHALEDSVSSLKLFLFRLVRGDKNCSTIPPSLKLRMQLIL